MGFQPKEIQLQAVGPIGGPIMVFSLMVGPLVAVSRMISGPVRVLFGIYPFANCVCPTSTQQRGDRHLRP